MTAPLSLIRKFHALTNRLDEALAPDANGDETYVFDPLDVNSLFERWAKVRAELIATEPEELSDLPDRGPPTTGQGKGLNSRTGVGRDQLERIRRDMSDAWDILNHPTRQVPQVSIDREGIFVAGQPFDAVLAITSIIRAATKSITLVDNWVSEETLSVLGVKQEAVAVKVLTKQASAALVTAAKAFRAQYGAGPPLELRTSTAFHDRFVVIDETECYHFGASIKDAAKKSAFMFSKIEEPTVVKVLQEEIAKQWKAATVISL